ncbi:MAG TPA: MarR family winged helix-turn-helix transcriptional regulator [Pseudonocardiaceae bacterium]|nr:MarR family winged helix-turn-helix transcriptional regulator [Pseudonocardiaceae bacterium]
MRTSHVENHADHQVNDDTAISTASNAGNAENVNNVADVGPAQPESSDPRLVAAGELGSQCTRFLRLVKRFAVQIVQQRNDGIESAAYALLAHVVCVGPQRLTALADAVHADPSTVSRQTTALVRHGLLERRADPLDGRASLLVATAEGIRVFDDNRRLRSQLLAKVLGSWSMADLESLTVLMDRLNTDFEAGADFSERYAEDFRTPGQSP